MRTWPWPPLLLLLALTGYLAFRVEQLDAKLATLAGGAAPAGARLEEGAETREELVDRLRSAEAEVATLRNRLDSLTSRVDPALEDMQEGADETRILDVVEQENARIRDRQLTFHSDRWMQDRDAALAKFAEHYTLSPWQVQQIHQHLQREVDDIVEIMKTKEALENPDQAVSDWTARLAETDRVVLEMLEGEQIAAWKQARAFERAIVMPWLPKGE